MPDREKPLADQPKKRAAPKRKNRMPGKSATTPSSNSAKSPIAAHHAATLSTPVVPPRPAPVLLKTTYNTARIRLAIAGAITASVVLIGAPLWWQRDRIAQVWRQAVPAKQINVLNVKAEQLDDGKRDTAQRVTGAFASGSAQASAPTAFDPGEGAEWPAIPSVAILETYTVPELMTILDRQISVLKSEGEDTRLLEKLKVNGAKPDLLKAIQLGKEYQALYLYYRK
jgi:hypothetical protein